MYLHESVRLFIEQQQTVYESDGFWMRFGVYFARLARQRC